MTQLLESPPANGQLARRQTVMGSLAERYSMDAGKLLDTIKATCIKGNATNEQTQAFLIVANRYGLDPFLKEIHAFASQGGGIVPIVGIDGWSKIANGTGKFDGCDFAFDGEGADLACTCTVYVKDRAHPVRVTEYMAECGRNTQPWKQYPRRMLRHKAFMQCVRLAFGLGGVFDEDEARDIVANDGTPVLPAAGAKRAFGPGAKAVVAHPTAEGRVIDTADGNLPDRPYEDAVRSAGGDPGEAIAGRNGEQVPRYTVGDDGDVTDHKPDPDVAGAEAEPPADALPDLSTYEKWYAAMAEWAAENNVAGFDALISKVNVAHKVQRPTAAGTAERQRVYAAALAGRLGADGKVKE